MLLSTFVLLFVTYDPVLIDRSHLGQGPYAEYDLSDDLFFGYAADGGVSGVDGYGSVVTHDKDFSVGYLVGKVDVTFTEGFAVCQIGLVKHLLVDVDIAVVVDVDPLAAGGDDSFYQDVIIIVESYDLAGLGFGLFEGEYDVSAVQGSLHGFTIDPEYRE